MKKIHDNKILAREIKRIVRDERLYRDIHLSREMLASRLGITPGRVSAIMKEELGTTFYEFVNSYRLAYAHKLLSSPYHQNDTLDDISILAGFSCRMTLHRMYRKKYGTTPRNK